MSKYISCFLLILVTFTLTAQDISISPYSSLGYGDKIFNHGASTFGMGGVSTSYLSPYGNEANFSNPAANNNLFYTTFSFEGAANFSRFADKQNESSRSSTYLSKVHLAFPMGLKFRGGIGFQPYSSVGYKAGIYDLESNPQKVNLYKGDGGINSLNAFLSYNINQNFAVGLRADYLFGKLKRNEVFSVQNTQLLTDYTYEDELKGFNLTAGLAFNKKVGVNQRFFAGATYGLGNKLKSTQSYQLSTYQLLSLGSAPINKDIIYEKSSNEDVKFPQQASLALSYGRDLKWLVGAQVDWEKTSELNFINQKHNSKDRLRLGLGGYYTPQFNSFRNYFQRVTYRFGGFYENMPFEINNQQINRYGITFGLGLPMGKSSDPSELNIGIELGQQGTKENNLIKESFANLRLGFNLSDTWFQKRKYD